MEVTPGLVGVMEFGVGQLHLVSVSGIDFVQFNCFNVSSLFQEFVLTYPLCLMELFPIMVDPLTTDLSTL